MWLAWFEMRALYGRPKWPKVITQKMDTTWQTKLDMFSSLFIPEIWWVCEPYNTDIIFKSMRQAHSVWQLDIREDCLVCVCVCFLIPESWLKPTPSFLYINWQWMKSQSSSLSVTQTFYIVWRAHILYKQEHTHLGRLVKTKFSVDMTFPALLSKKEGFGYL